MSRLVNYLFALFAIVLLAGCTSTNTTLNVNPSMTLPQADPSLMGVTISVTGADNRQDQALAKINRDGQLVTLTASRDLRYLLQETLEKQMAARGYMIGADGTVNVQIIVNQLFADVKEGNLRHNITTQTDIAIVAQAKNGNKQTKNYRSSYSVQGPLTASNSDITKSIDTVLNTVISDMANDLSVHEFIKQNAR